MTLHYGAIEAGGTKILCAIADGDGHWLDQVLIPTTGPHETVAAIGRFFAQHPPLASVGLASFGPINVNPESDNYGTIQTTSKPGWSGFAFGAALMQMLQTPVHITTDVLSAALAEHRFGAAKNKQHFCYVTVGTGIGVGVYNNGTPLSGSNHPEPGHLPLIRHPADKDFVSCCPYHAHCAEGLASGPALALRADAPLSQLAVSHAVWQIATFYLAQLCEWLNLCYQPELIVLGGGVLQSPGVSQLVRDQFRAHRSAYGVPLQPERIVTSQLDNRAGLMGALVLAAPDILPVSIPKESR